MINNGVLIKKWKFVYFQPYLVSKVFREIGYADELGSGMRNTNKYTKLYSGGTPTFIEDNVFKINIPIDHVANLQVGQAADIVANKTDNQKMSDKMSEIVSDKISDKLNKKEKMFLNLLIEQLKSREYVTTTIMADITDIPASTVRRYMNKLCKLKVIEAEGANKGKKYRLYQK